jgi:NADPH-dependent 2,4-dienoyl-CoA reductase/sulfur reductase-like enzyme
MSATFQPDRMPGYVLPKYAYRRPPELAGGTARLHAAIIVGGGLAGLTAALELGSRGVRCVLLDDDDTVGAQGLSSRGICPSRNSPRSSICSSPTSSSTWWRRRRRRCC